MHRRRVGDVGLDALDQRGEVLHEQVPVLLDVGLGGEQHVTERLQPEVGVRHRLGLDALQLELDRLVGDVARDHVGVAVDQRLRIEAHLHRLVVGLEPVDPEQRVDADLVAGGQADALADEVLDAADLRLGQPHQAVRRALVHRPEDHVVGALGVGLDQLQLVAGHADVGVAGRQHLGHGRRVRPAVEELDLDATGGEVAERVGEVPRRPLDVGHPVEGRAHGADDGTLPSAPPVVGSLLPSSPRSSSPPPSMTPSWRRSCGATGGGVRPGRRRRRRRPPAVPVRARRRRRAAGPTG